MIAYVYTESFVLKYGWLCEYFFTQCIVLKKHKLVPSLGLFQLGEIW